MAILAFSETQREGIYTALNKCRVAYATVRMLTGGSSERAIHAAR